MSLWKSSGTETFALAPNTGELAVIHFPGVCGIIELPDEFHVEKGALRWTPAGKANKEISICD